MESSISSFSVFCFQFPGFIGPSIRVDPGDGPLPQIPFLQEVKGVSEARVEVSFRSPPERSHDHLRRRISAKRGESLWIVNHWHLLAEKKDRSPAQDLGRVIEKHESLPLRAFS